MDAFAQLALMAKAKLVFEAENTFLSFPVLSPRTFPPERLKFAAPGNLTPQALLDLSEFARFVNCMPSGAVAPLEGDEYLWDVYGEVLETAQIAQDGWLSPEEQKRYAEASDVLYVQEADGSRRESDVLMDYRAHRDASIAAEEDYKNRKLTAEWSEDASVKAKWAEEEATLRAAVEQLLDDWRTSGHKAEVEAAQQLQEAHAARVPQLVWDQWKTSFLEGIDAETDGNNIKFALTGFSPYDLFDHGAWPSFELTRAEMTRLVAEAPADVQRIFGGDVGDSQVESISFEYRSVGITRSWLETPLFRSRFWRLGPDGGELSDGQEPPSGRCPSYVAGLVFARNVVIRSKGQATGTPPQSDQAKPGLLLALDPAILPGLHQVAATAAPRPTVRDHRTGAVAAIAPSIVASVAGQRPMVRDHRGERGSRTAPSFVRRAMVGRSSANRSGGPVVLARRRALGVPLTRARLRPPPVGSPIRPRFPVPPTGGTAPVPPPEPVVTTFPDVTVLAFICKRLPRCPDPDPGLVWA